MQVVDGLIVVHNMDEGDSQMWDLRISGPEWTKGLLKEGVSVDVQKAVQGRYLMEVIEKKEQKANDHAYKFFTTQLPIQFHQ